MECAQSARAGVRSPKEVSDLYLCLLAAAQAAKLATLDTGIKHPSALLIA